VLMCVSPRTMALLYSDPQWSVNKVFSSQGVHGDIPWWSPVNLIVPGPYWWLKTKSKDEDFSLSEVWGVLTSYLFMKHVRFICSHADVIQSSHSVSFCRSV
jgi:hypothetical protein